MLPVRSTQTQNGAVFVTPRIAGEIVVRSAIVPRPIVGARNPIDVKIGPEIVKLSWRRKEIPIKGSDWYYCRLEKWREEETQDNTHPKISHLTVSR
jgi:hypothetical protein